MARARGGSGRSRWDEDNRLVLNPWAFAAVGALVGGIAGLALLIWLLLGPATAGPQGSTPAPTVGRARSGLLEARRRGRS